MSPIWTVIASVAGGSVVAVFVTYLLNLKRENRERTSAKQALQAEIAWAEEQARGYLRIGTPRAPAWRPPSTIYMHALTKLLALGAIDGKATRAILIYYDHVASFSRALDSVEAAKGTPKFGREHSRAFVKATLLVSAGHIRTMQTDPTLGPPHQRYLNKRVRVYGGRMPFDLVMRELAVVPTASSR